MRWVVRVPWVERIVLTERDAVRFTTRILVLQLATVVSVVVVCVVVFLVLTVQQLRAGAETAALNIARTVAEDPQVRAAVAEISADPGTPDGAALADGDLQELANAITARTGTLFVVITDDYGIRLAHPDSDLLGQEVSTDFADVLAGNEVVEWERGTLGESARAKVPIYPPGASAETAAVGEVSVGFEPASVFDDLPALIGGFAAAAGGALVLGTLAALLMRRRWERLTLGLQPEELVALVQNQAAVLDGIGDGVVALDSTGIVRVCNRTATDLLALSEPVGRALSDLGLPAAVVVAVQDGTARDGVVVGGRVLFVDAQSVERSGRSLGTVLVVRDRTDVVGLSERLETVRAMSGALRVQRHEFANRLHVATGLIDADRISEARDFLAEQLGRGPVDYGTEGIELVTDGVLQSLIGAMSTSAGERGVIVRVAADSLLLHPVDEVEDVAAVLGNLVDNAVTAAVRGEEPRDVEVGLYADGADLVLTVADSGRGLPPDADPFTRRAPTGDSDRIHGLGVGLPLARELARRRDGDVWIIARGGADTGAVFGARIGRALRMPIPPEEPR